MKLDVNKIKLYQWLALFVVSACGNAAMIIFFLLLFAKEQSETLK